MAIAEFNWISEPTRNESVSVSTSSLKICDARIQQNPRTVILVRNISGDGTRISATLGNFPAVANQGIILEDGESFSDTSEINYKCFQGAIQAIASTVTGKLSIFER